MHIIIERTIGYAIYVLYSCTMVAILVLDFRVFDTILEFLTLIHQFQSTPIGFPVICNYRHSQRMIEKLRSAGLGFCVNEVDTHQKLGLQYNFFHIEVHSYYNTHRKNSSPRAGVSCDCSSS